MFHICRKLAQTWFINDWQKGLPRSGGEVHPSCVSSYFTLFLAIVIVPPTSLCASADAPPPPKRSPSNGTKYRSCRFPVLWGKPVSNEGLMKLLGLKSAMEKKEFEKPLAELFCAVRRWGYQGWF